MSGRVVPTAHPDRAGCPRWLQLALSGAVAVALAVSFQVSFADRFSPAAGYSLGFGIGVLAMVGLPSISIRLLARVLLFISALGLVRFGLISGSIATGGQGLLLWLVAAVFVLVLSDRVGTDASAPLADGDGGGSVGAGGPASTGSPRPSTTIRSAALVAGLVLLVAIVLAPVLLPYVGDAVEPGQGATLDAMETDSSILRSTDSLDMTTRPELTDEVVMTVDSDRATFWRGQTFDVWDGRSWTRSDPRFIPLAGPDEPQLGAEDLGARGTDVVEQRFRIEAPFSDIVYAVPTAVEVQIDRPLRQRADGTLESAPLGRGATYSVTSRRNPLTVEQLRAASGEIPAEVRQQYAQEPVMTDRVREAALDVTAGETTQYDQVLALQAWMGERVEYSLDAPLAPKGVDVVDHFLFEAEEGWCEQIASSLVVLARANGIPARLVTGYVPGDHDPVTGQFTVRMRDAHAWAEVWFPEVGWVPFDPTADVPLAGDDQSDPTIGQWIQDHLVVIGLAVAAIVLLIGPVRMFVRRRRAQRAARPVGWPAAADHRLDALGARVDRPRLDHETATAYARALALRYGDDRLVAAGTVIDDATYAPLVPGPAVLAEVDALLDELAAAPVPEPEPEPVAIG
jgi:transglutaminase-like putative cysteine protease